MAAAIGGLGARRYGVVLGAIVVCYVATAMLGFAWTGPVDTAPLVWAPSGIALAALLLVGRSVWPAIFTAALVVALWKDVPLAPSLAIAAGNTLEAVVAAYLVQRIAGFRSDIDRLAHAIALVVFGGVLSPAISATIGVTSLHLVGRLAHADLATAWHSWWLGDAVGIVVFAPFILTLVHLRRMPRPTCRELAEVGLIGVTFVTVSSVLFLMRHPRIDPYMIFPILMWATIRFGIAGATIATWVTSLIWRSRRPSSSSAHSPTHRSRRPQRTFEPSRGSSPSPGCSSAPRSKSAGAPSRPAKSSSPSSRTIYETL
jgi:integral membrane sensor domain MASE1